MNPETDQHTTDAVATLKTAVEKAHKPSLTVWLCAYSTLLCISLMLWWAQPEALRPPEPIRWEHVAPQKVEILRDWEYIIIHHSGAGVGDPEGIDRDHQSRGWEGIGYHFVIGNDRPMPIGSVQWTFRWNLQRHGAHVKVGSINQKGIGICLIGNYDNEPEPTLQLRRAAELCALLVERIPSLRVENILGHGEVDGTNTNCPGSHIRMNHFRHAVAQQLRRNAQRQP